MAPNHSTPSFSCVWCVCNMCMHVYICSALVCMCVGASSWWGCLYQLLPTLLTGGGLSLNPDLHSSVHLAIQLASGIPYLCLPNVRISGWLQNPHQHLRGCWRASFLSSRLHGKPFIHRATPASPPDSFLLIPSPVVATLLLLQGFPWGSRRWCHLTLPCLSGRRKLFTLLPLCLLALLLPSLFAGMLYKFCRDWAEIRGSNYCLIVNRSPQHCHREPLQPAAKGWSLGQKKGEGIPTSHPHGKSSFYVLFHPCFLAALLSFASTSLHCNGRHKGEE